MTARTEVKSLDDGRLRIVAGSCYDTAVGRTSVDFTMTRATAQGLIVAVAKALGLSVVHDLTADA